MRKFVVLVCLLACGCAGRPSIGVVITNAPDSLECSSPTGRGNCR